MRPIPESIPFISAALLPDKRAHRAPRGNARIRSTAFQGAFRRLADIIAVNAVGNEHGVEARPFRAADVGFKTIAKYQHRADSSRRRGFAARRQRGLVDRRMRLSVIDRGASELP